MKADDLLVLNVGGFGRRLDALYGRLAQDEGLREYFVKDPGAVLDATTFRNFRRTPAEKINQFNRALFSVLSNPEFMKWGEEFRERTVREAKEAFPTEEDPNVAMRAYLVKLDRQKLHQELVEVLPKFLDRELVFASFGFIPGRSYPSDPGTGPLPGTDPCPDMPDSGGPDLGGPCTSPPPPIGPNPIGDTVVAAETAVVVVAVAVFVVAISMVDFTPRVSPVGMTRDDVRSALASLQKQLQHRAKDLRERGVLSDTMTFEGPWRG